MLSRRPCCGALSPKSPRRGWPRFLFACALGLCLFLSLTGCAGNAPRPYYKRGIGSYWVPDGRHASLRARPPEFPVERGDGDKLRKAAESYLGVRYRFGGQSRWGMDCSGLVRQVFQEAYQVKLPHHSAAMAKLGQPVSRSDLRPGDIVFFKNWFFIDHSGIYMGRNWFIHSQSSQGVVYTRMDAPYFSTHYAGARRVYLSNP